jgi:hypothetical protein
VVALLSRAALYVGGASSSSSSSSSALALDHYALLACAGRPRVLVPPTGQRAALFTTRFDDEGGGELALAAGLKLALVRGGGHRGRGRAARGLAGAACHRLQPPAWPAPLRSAAAAGQVRAAAPRPRAGLAPPLTRSAPAPPQLAGRGYRRVRVVLLAASAAAGLSAAEQQQLRSAFAGAGATLQVVCFSAAAAPAGDLRALAEAVGARAAAAGTAAPAPALLEFAPPDEDAPLWEQLEPVSQCMDPRPDALEWAAGLQQQQQQQQQQQRQDVPGESEPAAAAAAAAPGRRPVLRPAARPLQSTCLTRLARTPQPRHCR